MRGFLARVLPIALLAGALGGCTLTLPSLFGAAPLTLTGSLADDMPGIQAYSAAIRAGVRTDIAKVREQFVKLCPYLPAVQQSLPAALDAAAQVMNLPAAQKTVNNAADALNVGIKFCNVGVADNLPKAMVATLDAVRTVQDLAKMNPGVR